MSKNVHSLLGNIPGQLILVIKDQIYNYFNRQRLINPKWIEFDNHNWGNNLIMPTTFIVSMATLLVSKSNPKCLPANTRPPPPFPCALKALGSEIWSSSQNISHFHDVTALIKHLETLKLVVKIAVKNILRNICTKVSLYVIVYIYQKESKKIYSPNSSYSKIFLKPTSSSYISVFIKLLLPTLFLSFYHGSAQSLKRDVCLVAIIYDNVTNMVGVAAEVEVCISWTEKWKFAVVWFRVIRGSGG